MERVRELWRRVSSLGRRDELESGMDEEIQFHIERQTEKNIRQGMSPAEARRSALVKFGGVERARERIRDEFRPMVIEDFSRDLKYGVRTLVRGPGFSLVAILTLGLGIGAATAVYSVVHGVLLRPLPYPEEGRIVRLFQIDEDGNRMGQVSEPNFNDWKSQSRSFAALAEIGARGKVTITGNFEPHRAPVAYVSREFLAVMCVSPALGRAFAPEDQRLGAVPVALVSDAYWRRWLGGTPTLAGQTISFGTMTFQVVGVMPASFNYPVGTEVWAPRELLDPQIRRTGHNFLVVGRLKDGIEVEAARTELSSISRALKTQYGDDTWMSDATLIPLREQMTASSKPLLVLLFGASAFLLLIACANVSNLLLARAANRQRELAVRLAIGAGRWRLTRQLLAESLVLCLTGSAVGLVIAYYGVRGLLALEPTNLARINEVHVSASALAFALGVALVTAITLGLATTFHAARGDL